MKGRKIFSGALINAGDNVSEKEWAVWFNCSSEGSVAISEEVTGLGLGSSSIAEAISPDSHIKGIISINRMIPRVIKFF
ncbi:MAG: hypothetical protein AB8G95_02940 [Anaerolineae bacterium]